MTKRDLAKTVGVPVVLGALAFAGLAATPVVASDNPCPRAHRLALGATSMGAQAEDVLDRAHRKLARSAEEHNGRPTKRAYRVAELYIELGDSWMYDANFEQASEAVLACINRGGA